MLRYLNKPETAKKMSSLIAMMGGLELQRVSDFFSWIKQKKQYDKEEDLSESEISDTSEEDTDDDHTNDYYDD